MQLLKKQSLKIKACDLHIFVLFASFLSFFGMTLFCILFVFFLAFCNFFFFSCYELFSLFFAIKFKYKYSIYFSACKNVKLILI